MKKPYNQFVPAVDEAARILFFMASQRRREFTLTVICQGVGIHKPKGLSILNTLAEHGLVNRNHLLKTWSLGPSILALSSAVIENTTLGSLAEPYLASIAEKTGSAALFGLVSRDRLVIVAREEPEGYHGVTIRAGHRYPLDWGAHGEIFAAHDGATGGEKFAAKRYAVDIGRMQRGVNAVAAPVYGKGLLPVGCILVVGTFTEAEADAMGQVAADAARDLSARYGSAIEDEEIGEGEAYA